MNAYLVWRDRYTVLQILKQMYQCRHLARLHNLARELKDEVAAETMSIELDHILSADSITEILAWVCQLLSKWYEKEADLKFESCRERVAQIDLIRKETQ